MTLGSAVGLWGSEAVHRALDEPHPEPLSVELATEVRARAMDAPAFARWALTLSWPRFCTVVRIVTGDATQNLMEEDTDD